jgi:DNA-directed RNA polymerase subunit RPC12/RpoP
MAVENVACPHCGSETLATVPSGQRVVKVADYDMKGGSGHYVQVASCSRCGKKFYVLTKEISH